MIKRGEGQGPRKKEKTKGERVMITDREEGGKKKGEERMVIMGSA